MHLYRDSIALVQRREGRLGRGVIGLGHLLYVKQKSKELP